MYEMENSSYPNRPLPTKAESNEWANLHDIDWIDSGKPTQEPEVEPDRQIVL